MRKHEQDSDLLFGSFTSAVGLALGDLLLFAGRPEALRGCLASIETAAYGTLLSSDVKPRGGPTGTSFASASLRVIRASQEDDDPASLGRGVPGASGGS